MINPIKPNIDLCVSLNMN